MENFGKFCLGLIIIVANALIGGYVFMKLWLWFVVGIFHLQTITLTQGIALVFFINYLKFRITKDDERKGFDWSKIGKQFVQFCTYSAFTLALSYIIKQII